MALKKCKECGKEVSTQADKCPHCGATLKTKVGCFGSVIIAIAFLIILTKFIDTGKKETLKDKDSILMLQKDNVKERKIYKMEDGFRVGYTSYCIWEAWWSEILSHNRYLNERPNESYLFITLTVRNDDIKPRSIPPFKLIDENNAEYETTSKAWAVKGSIGVLESLNPGVSKGGIIIFDVPMHHQYKLKVSGGYWSKDEAYVEIVPSAKRVQKKKTSKKK